MESVWVKFKNGTRQQFGPETGHIYDADEWLGILSIKRVVHGVPDLRAFKQFSMHEVEAYGSE